MTTETVRAILAILIVGIFMIITGLMLVMPLFIEEGVMMGEYADFFAKTSSIYVGIVGVVIGYYFGRSSDGDNKNKPSSPKPNS